MNNLEQFLRNSMWVSSLDNNFDLTGSDTKYNYTEPPLYYSNDSTEYSKPYISIIHDHNLNNWKKVLKIALKREEMLKVMGETLNEKSLKKSQI